MQNSDVRKNSFIILPTPTLLIYALIRCGLSFFSEWLRHSRDGRQIKARTGKAKFDLLMNPMGCPG